MVFFNKLSTVLPLKGVCKKSSIEFDLNLILFPLSIDRCLSSTLSNFKSQRMSFSLKVTLCPVIKAIRQSQYIQGLLYLSKSMPKGLTLNTFIEPFSYPSQKLGLVKTKSNNVFGI